MVEYRETPTAAQVLRRTRKLPPVDHDAQATAMFAGTAVLWRVRFFSAQPIFDLGHSFSFSQRGFFWPAPGRTTLIFAHVDLNLNPELRDLRRSQRMNLYGSIADVDQFLGVTLKLDRAEILPLTFFDRLIGFFNRGTS